MNIIKRSGFFILLSLLLIVSISKTTYAEPAKESNEILFRDALLGVISNNINDALAGYYGTTPNYHLFSTEVVNIKRQREGEYSFTLKVKVKTWSSPSPPFGLDTLTIDISPMVIAVTKFEHKDITSLE